MSEGKDLEKKINELDEEAAVYVISVAAEYLDCIHKLFVNTIVWVWYHQVEPVDAIVAIHFAISRYFATLQNW